MYIYNFTNVENVTNISLYFFHLAGSGSSTNNLDCWGGSAWQTILNEDPSIGHAQQFNANLTLCNVPSQKAIRLRWEVRGRDNFIAIGNMSFIDNQSNEYYFDDFTPEQTELVFQERFQVETRNFFIESICTFKRNQ